MYNRHPKFSRLFIIADLSIVLCFSSAFGQSDETSYAGQKPLEVQVTRQDDSPLTLSVTNVDNSGVSSQVIHLLIHNVGAKPVRGYVMLIGGMSSGSQSSGSLTKNLFEPYEMRTDQFSEHRGNVRSGEALMLSIDYVDFVDGTSWGADTRGESVRIAGENAGARSALSRIKEIIKTKDDEGLRTFLAQQPETASDLHVSPDRPELWQAGFRNRYRAVLRVVRDARPNDIKSILSLVDKMERVVGGAE